MTTFAPCVNLRTLGYRTTGVQRYLLNLIPYMPKELHPIKPSQPLQGIKGHLWEQLYLPVQLGKRLLWSPGNTGPVGVSRQVLTLHDAASLDHPEWFERKFACWYSILLPILVRKVRAVITVSAFSKERILRRTGIESKRVHVISNGVEGRFRPTEVSSIQRAKAEYGLTDPYILFVGSLESRKNLGVLVEAWRIGRFAGATLAVAGASSHVFSTVKLGQIPEGVRLLGHVPDEVLPALYSGAVGFVYPSVYEGFGLPPLEAMACGCPVMVSDIPSHREVCGDVAQYFDPLDSRELSIRLDWLLRLDRRSRLSLGGRGIERANGYSWQKSAIETWRVIQLFGDN